MKRLAAKRDEPPRRPITFRAAEDLGPFELAQLWCDRTAWPIDERTQYDELSELAVMSALATWLRRWQPIAIHGAILAGARPEAVAGALGESLQVAFERWHEWARLSATSSSWQAGHHGRGVRQDSTAVRRHRSQAFLIACASVANGRQFSEGDMTSLRYRFGITPDARAWSLSSIRGVLFSLLCMTCQYFMPLHVLVPRTIAPASLMLA